MDKFSGFGEIISWNGRSLRGKQLEVEHLLLQHRTAILTVTESRVDPHFNLKRHIGYHAATSNDISMTSIFIRKDIKHFRINIPASLHHINVSAVRIVEKTKFTIVCLYRHQHTPLTLTDLSNLATLGSPILITGDFNAHHPFWGASKTTPSGTIIADFLSEGDLVLLNDGSPTYFNKNYTSTLDLTFISPSLAQKATWTAHKETLGSDHYLTSISGLLQKTSGSFSKTLTNWTTFNTHLNNLTANRDYTQEDLGEAMRASLKAATEKFHLPKGCHTLIPEINKLQALRRKATNKVRRNGSLSAAIEAKRLSAKLKRTIKKSRKQSWNKFCAQINQHSQDSTIWQRIKKIEQPISPTYPWTQLVALRSSPKQAADDLLDHFLHPPTDNSLNSEPNSPPSTSNTSNISQKDIDSLNKDLTLRELELAIASCTKKSAPGPDLIPNSAYKACNRETRKLLLGNLNRIWDTGHFPHHWASAIICPIHKSGKPPEELSSYRPIALTCTIVKLVEKIIKSRLVPILENHKKLPHNITGFRDGRSAQWNIIDLSTAIEQAFCKGEITIVVFIDIKAAFDTVSHSAIISTLEGWNISGRSLRFIKFLLTQRKTSVKLGNTLSREEPVKTGVPQGGVLSPLCFNAILADLPNHLPEEVISSFYADDIAIWSSGRDISALQVALQRALNTITRYCAQRNLTIAPEKTVAVPFSRGRRNLQAKFHLQVNGNDITNTSEHRFLGTIFDQHLRWNTQIQERTNACKRRLSMLKCLAGGHQGSGCCQMIKFYKAFILSKLTFGCSQIANPTGRISESLEKIQLSALRICLGTPKCTRSTSLRAETSSPQITWLLRKDLDILLRKIASLEPEHPIFARLLDPTNISSVASFFRTSAHAGRFPLRLRGPLPLHWELNLPRIILDIPGLSSKDSFSPEAVCSLVALNSDTLALPEQRIFCDGAYAENLGNGGAAFVSLTGVDIAHHPSERWFLPVCYSSTHAELSAILKALEWILRHGSHKYTIFSDSKAALSSLLSHPKKWFLNPLTQQILNLASNCKARGLISALCWIPGHSGIPGNEWADREAKCALRNLAALTFEDTPTPPFEIAWIKKQHLRSWTPLWSTEDSTSFRHAHSPLPSRIGPTSSSRASQTTFNRMRLGVALTNSLLFRWKMVDSPNCIHCGTSACETIEHLFFECPAHADARKQLMDNLTFSNLPLPTSTASLLCRRTGRANELVHQFITIFLARINKHL